MSKIENNILVNVYDKKSDTGRTAQYLTPTEASGIVSSGKGYFPAGFDYDIADVSTGDKLKVKGDKLQGYLSQKNYELVGSDAYTKSRQFYKESRSDTRVFITNALESALTLGFYDAENEIDNSPGGRQLRDIYDDEFRSTQLFGAGTGFVGSLFGPGALRVGAAVGKGAIGAAGAIAKGTGLTSKLSGVSNSAKLQSVIKPISKEGSKLINKALEPTIKGLKSIARNNPNAVKTASQLYVQGAKGVTQARALLSKYGNKAIPVVAAINLMHKGATGASNIAVNIASRIGIKGPRALSAIKKTTQISSAATLDGAVFGAGYATSRAIGKKSIDFNDQERYSPVQHANFSQALSKGKEAFVDVSLLSGGLQGGLLGLFKGVKYGWKATG